MKLTAVGEIKNGLLWDAVKKFGGSQKALADFLGVASGELSAWLKLKQVPSLAYRRTARSRDWDTIERKLFDLTNHLLDEIFPQELLGSEFLKSKKKWEHSVEIPTVSLLEAPKEFLTLPPVQEDIVMTKELERDVAKAIATLTPREENLIRRRFGLGGEDEETINEIGHDFAVSPSRIRQIEAKALLKLRCPERSRPLRDHVR
jgi:RNA polymerase sigma factor (sigma-70 family)